MVCQYHHIVVADLMKVCQYHCIFVVAGLTKVCKIHCVVVGAGFMKACVSITVLLLQVL